VVALRDWPRPRPLVVWVDGPGAGHQGLLDALLGTVEESGPSIVLVVSSAGSAVQLPTEGVEVVALGAMGAGALRALARTLAPSLDEAQVVAAVRASEGSPRWLRAALVERGSEARLGVVGGAVGGRGEARRLLAAVHGLASEADAERLLDVLVGLREAQGAVSEGSLTVLLGGTALVPESVEAAGLVEAESGREGRRYRLAEGVWGSAVSAYVAGANGMRLGVARRWVFDGLLRGGLAATREARWAAALSDLSAAAGLAARLGVEAVVRVHDARARIHARTRNEAGVAREVAALQALAVGDGGVAEDALAAAAIWGAWGAAHRREEGHSGERVEERFEEAVEVASRAPGRVWVALAQVMAGREQERRGDLAGALARVRPVSYTHSPQGDTYDAAVLRGVIHDATLVKCAVYTRQGEVERALTGLLRLHQAYRAEGDGHGELYASMAVVRAMRRRTSGGRGQEAAMLRGMLGRAEALVTTLGDPHARALWAWERASLLEHEGEAEAAVGQYTLAQALFELSGDANDAAMVSNVLGELARAAGRYADAVGHYAAFKAQMDASGHRLGQGVAAMNLGWAQLGLGELGEARAWFEEAVRLFGEVGPSFVAEARVGLVLTWVGADPAVAAREMAALDFGAVDDQERGRLLGEVERVEERLAESGALESGSRAVLNTLRWSMGPVEHVP